MGCLLRGKFRLGWEGRSAGSGRRLSAPAPEGEHVPRAATPPSSRDYWRRWAGWHSLRLNPGWARTRPADPIWAGGTQPYTGRVRSILCHAAWDDAGNKVFSHRAQVTFADSGVAAPRRFEDPLKATQATLGRQCRWERREQGFIVRPLWKVEKHIRATMESWMQTACSWIVAFLLSLGSAVVGFVGNVVPEAVSGWREQAGDQRIQAGHVRSAP